MAIVKISDLPLVDSPVEGTDLFVVVQDNVTKKAYASDIQTYVGFEEIQYATAGQTVFNLTTMSYAPGGNNLMVFVDGVNQYEGLSYTETNSTRVTFTQGLHVGAVVKFSTVQTQTSQVASAGAVTFLQAGTGAVARSVQSKERDIVNVKDFGAQGDGIANDAPAINAALTYLASIGGGVLNFGPGTFVVNSTIYLRSLCALKGSGIKTTTIKLGNNVNANIFESFGGGANGVGLYDMTIDGNQNNNTAGGLYLVGSFNTRGPSYQIERIRFTKIHTAIYGAGNRGAVVVAGNDWAVIRDCDFINNDFAQIALLWSAADSIIDGIYIGTNGFNYSGVSYGFWLSTSGCFITNCYFGGTQIGPQVRLFDASANKFTSCIFDNAGTTGIQIAGNSVFNQFIGGQIGNSTYSNGGTYYTVENSVNNSATIFSGVTFYATYATAPAQYGYYEPPGINGNSQLIGCQFYGTWVIGPVSVPAASTTAFVGCQGYDITNVATLKASQKIDVSGAYTNAAPSTSSTPIARFNNGGAISLWSAAKGYDYTWLQSIQDDGTNTVKPLRLQPLGGAVEIGGNGGGITVTSPNGLVSRKISIDNSGNVVAV